MRYLAFSAALAVLISPAAAHDVTTTLQIAASDPVVETAAAATPAAAPPPWNEATGGAPKLMEGLGTHTYKITASAAAQRFFDQGFVWAYAFNQPEAFRGFAQAAKLDPNCAMCFWGQAYVLGPNLNIPMDPRADDTAKAAATDAVAKATTDKERALGEAMLKRYSGTGGERAEQDKHYADAMVEVAARFPDDPDIATLAAESLMLLSPWDYWLDQGRTPKEATTKALALLEGALKTNPGHIGATHFYVHLVEASTAPERAAAFADTLRTAVPAAGHLVHMPSHIYMRIGRLKDSVDDNNKAALADERYLAANQEVHGPYGLIYYPHNVHFELVSSLMLGDAKTSLAAADKLMGLIDEQTALALPPVQPIKQAPYFAYAQFGDPARIMALADPGPKLPFVQAAWHFARGVAQLEQGHIAEARAEAAAIKAIGEGNLDELAKNNVPAKAIVDIARDVLSARIEAKSGNPVEAEKMAKQAVEAESTLPYMEPAYWYMPATHTLGAVLLRGGDPRGASDAFEQALKAMPNSTWALKGLAESETASGDAAKAAEAKKTLEGLLPKGDMSPDLDRL